MNIAVVHNHIGPDAPADEQDVLEQAEAVCAALSDLGHYCRTVSCSLNLEEARRDLSANRPDLVFNLVESLEGSCCLLPLFPAMLDHMGIPYTGSRAFALWTTTHKLLAKRALASGGIPTPAWAGPVPEDPTCPPVALPPFSPADRWIVKSLWEHASFGLDDGCVVTAIDEAALMGKVRERAAALGGECFAEAYVDGREFNLAILDSEDGPQVLPPAEIEFPDFGDRLRIVGYRAKWEAASFEYHNTPRRFAFPKTDRPLLSLLREAALACWRLFGLRGYARVDFRVDAQGRPWVLEVNANPCLSPDAGFAAALAEAGISFPLAVRRILVAALGGAELPLPVAAGDR